MLGTVTSLNHESSRSDLSSFLSQACRHKPFQLNQLRSLPVELLHRIFDELDGTPIFLSVRDV